MTETTAPRTPHTGAPDDFAYDRHGIVLSPSGHSTRTLLAEDRVAALLGPPTGIYLTWVGISRGLNPYLCWFIVSTLTIAMSCGLRLTRMWLVDRDVKAHGYHNVDDYRRAAAHTTAL